MNRLRLFRRTPKLAWVSCDHDDEPRDQLTDLPVAHLWAEVGPDTRRDPDGWSWTVLDFAADNDVVADGFAANEAEAKAAVRALTRRLWLGRGLP